MGDSSKDHLANEDEEGVPSSLEEDILSIQKRMKANSREVGAELDEVDTQSTEDGGADIVELKHELEREFVRRKIEFAKADMRTVHERERTRADWGNLVKLSLGATVFVTLLLVALFSVLDATALIEGQLGETWAQVITQDVIKALITASVAQAGILAVSVVSWAFIDRTSKGN